MASTTILKVKIVNGSGKIRTGGPGDEKKDTDREDITSRVWTGVLPIWEAIGDPVTGGAGQVNMIPEHVSPSEAFFALWSAFHIMWGHVWVRQLPVAKVRAIMWWKRNPQMDPREVKLTPILA